MFFGDDRAHEFYIGAHQHAADRGAVSVQEFRGGVHDEIGSEREGLLQVRGGKGVIASHFLPIFFDFSNQSIQDIFSYRVRLHLF